jgi:chromosomal replication initiation ATPase DnaA
LPDLRSRLGAALHLTIGAPDDDMTASLIDAHARQRGLVLGEGATTYLVPRTERSFAGIEKLVAAIDRISLERKQPATLSIWRDALEAVNGAEQPRLL